MQVCCEFIICPEIDNIWKGTSNHHTFHGEIIVLPFQRTVINFHLYSINVETVQASFNTSIIREIKDKDCTREVYGHTILNGQSHETVLLLA